MYRYANSHPVGAVTINGEDESLTIDASGYHAPFIGSMWRATPREQNVYSFLAMGQTSLAVDGDETIDVTLSYKARSQHVLGI